MTAQKTGTGAAAHTGGTDATDHAIRTAEAIAAHEQWKETLLEAIRTGATALSVAVVARDDGCELGRWLQNLAQTGAATDSTFLAIVAEHRRFHEHAARILRMAVDGRSNAALRALEGEYALISAELRTLLLSSKQL